jgi:hypothetical protein
MHPGKTMPPIEKQLQVLRSVSNDGFHHRRNSSDTTWGQISPYPWSKRRYANTGLPPMANHPKSCEPQKEKEPILELFIVQKFIFTQVK